MKVIPIALASHYAGGSTTLAHGLRITRTDGRVFAFTSAGIDAPIGGTLYSAAQGLDIGNLVTSAGLNVDNLELTTLDDGTLFTAADIRAGVWQNAAFLIFEYNWASPADGVQYLLAGTIGNVTLQLGSIRAELRGLQQYLQQPLGSVTSKTCRARFADQPAPAGNNRCRLNAGAWTDVVAVTAVTDRRTFAVGPTAYVPGDTYWSQVGLLLSAVGADGSTSIVDSSSVAHTVTAVGNARIRTVAGGGQAKWGSSALYFDGAGDCATVADTPNIVLTGDFTFEAWIYIEADTGSNQGIFTLQGTSWELYRRASSGNALALYNGSNIIIGGTAIATGGWHFVQWSRSGSTHTIYLDGVSQGTASASGTIDPTGIIVGAFNAGGTSEPLKGFMQDVRLTVGVARSGTSVPTAAMPAWAPSGGLVRADDWYTAGLATWLTGASAGLQVKVKAHTSGSTLELMLPLQHDIAVGDTVSLLAGCQKRVIEDCKTRFSNSVNFSGEPHLPGIDQLTSVPTPAA